MSDLGRKKREMTKRRLFPRLGGNVESSYRERAKSSQPPCPISQALTFRFQPEWWRFGNEVSIRLDSRSLTSFPTFNPDLPETARLRRSVMILLSRVQTNVYRSWLTGHTTTLKAGDFEAVWTARFAKEGVGGNWWTFSSRFRFRFPASSSIRSATDSLEFFFAVPSLS